MELDDSGNYSVLLGSAKNEGVPPELFAPGQSRWLQVKFYLPAEVELPRVLLVSVPYALKAGDAATIGGLPPSAFVLAAPGASAQYVAQPATVRPADTTPNVGGGGTQNHLPMWLDSSGNLGNSILFQSGSGTTAKIGVNITTPASTLDVKGASTLRGVLTLPSLAAATATTGYKSEPLDLSASVFNSGIGTAVKQTFQWQAEPLANNTTNAGGSLNLLYATGTNSPAETGLRVGSNGLVTFAAGQIFPGTGTITGVSPGTGLSGGGTTGSITLTNTGVLAVSPGTGISSSGGNSPTLSLNTSYTDARYLQLGGGVLTGSLILPANALVAGGSQLVLSSGRVGIGTSAPAATLEVNGAAQVDGNLTMSGSILSSGVPVLQAPNNASGNFSGGLAALTRTTGTYNTALGASALQLDTAGLANTASGYQTLLNNTTGNWNTAGGAQALTTNTTGFNNTAVGGVALQYNTTGNDNAAVGFIALNANTTGYDNAAIGSSALSLNSTGNNNTASGYGALYSDTASGNTANGALALHANTTGSDSVAAGFLAMYLNTTGSYNTAAGYEALSANTTGSYDTAIGAEAQMSNTTGSYNTAIGQQALYSATSGDNIAVGRYAGGNITTGSYNIEIGNVGLSNDNGVIRIGDSSINGATFIAGIRAISTGINNAVPVLIDSNGQLGTSSSSRRFKEDINDMGDASSGLLRLRPVTFRYKKPFSDGSKPIQYGLIAEEVAEVYPDLVARGSDGQIETVKYQLLDPMLLNELQKQGTAIETQKEQIRSLQDRLAKVAAALAGLLLTKERH